MESAAETVGVIRVIVAEDHPVVRNGILSMLSNADGIEVVGEVTSGKAAILMVQDIHPDVLLLDINLEEMNGVEVARWVLSNAPGVRILVLSAYVDHFFISELFQLGVSGDLTKGEPREVILQAIRGVARGEMGWISREVSAQILSGIQSKNSAPNTTLTPREMEVLRQVVEGKTNQSIGYQLEISEKTVEKYMEAIFRKLDVTSRVQAAVYALNNHLVE